MVIDVYTCIYLFILSVKYGIGLNIISNLLREYDDKKDEYIMVMLAVYMCAYPLSYGKDLTEHTMVLLLNSMIDILLVLLVILAKFKLYN